MIQMRMIREGKAQTGSVQEKESAILMRSRTHPWTRPAAERGPDTGIPDQPCIPVCLQEGQTDRRDIYQDPETCRRSRRPSLPLSGGPEDRESPETPVYRSAEADHSPLPYPRIPYLMILSSFSMISSVSISCTSNRPVAATYENTMM